MGVGLVTIVVMAHLFPPRESTGVLLPLLISGDMLSVIAFHRHAQWKHIARMFPPTALGVVAGFAIMHFIPDAKFGPVIGWTVLAMAALQAARKWRPQLFERVPHTRPFAWTMGGCSGVSTMLANAAGPVMALYFLAINLPKYELVGTSAWFFLLVNFFKVPFSAQLGLITFHSLLFNLMLVPIVALGVLSGRCLMKVIPQAVFENLLLIFTVLAALRLVGVF
jgi:hypothetical protein